MSSRHVSTVIAADTALVARLAGDPANLPVWAVRQRDMSEEDFAADCAAVAADLEALRRLIESGWRGGRAA